MHRPSSYVRAPCGTRQLGNPSSPCGHRIGPHTVLVPLAHPPGIPRGCEGSETSQSDTRAESERGGASLSLPPRSYHYRGGALVVVPPPQGNLSPVSRPPVSAPLRLAHRATDGHDRSHDSQRVACRTARRTPAQPPAACVAAAGLVALAAVALLCGPAARATRSTPPRGGPRLRVPARSDVRSVGFMRAAAHRRRRR